MTSLITPPHQTFKLYLRYVSPIKTFCFMLKNEVPKHICLIREIFSTLVKRRPTSTSFGVISNLLKESLFLPSLKTFETLKTFESFVSVHSRKCVVLKVTLLEKDEMELMLRPKQIYSIVLVQLLFRKCRKC